MIYARAPTLAGGQPHYRMTTNSKHPLQALLHLSASEKEARGIVHTPQEIFQQPECWRNTYHRCREQESEINSFLQHAGVGGNSPPVVFLIGAGSSDYIGRSLVDLLRRRWRTEVSAVPSTDLLPNQYDFVADRSYLWISFSRSGDSPEGVAVLERTLETCPNVRHVVVTCNQSGAMAQRCAAASDRALALILDDAVNDRGLAMTNSFTNMLVAGQCLAHFRDLAQYEEILGTMVDLATKFLITAAEAAASLTCQQYSIASFTGTGPLRAVATECALKMLELTSGRVRTMSESTLGLRHGPMSALDDNALVVQFISGEPKRRKYEIDLLQELCAKKLGKQRLAVTPQHFEELDAVADHILTLEAPEAFEDDYRVPVDVILGQLLGLFASIQAGLKPDAPSPGGVISRVVSGVKIYP